MAIIDSQVHAYAANMPQRPWHRSHQGWSDDVTCDEPFRLTNRLNHSKRAMLMDGACAKVYGWPPKKYQ